MTALRGKLLLVPLAALMGCSVAQVAQQSVDGSESPNRSVALGEPCPGIESGEFELSITVDSIYRTSTPPTLTMRGGTPRFEQREATAEASDSAATHLVTSMTLENAGDRPVGLGLGLNIYARLINEAGQQFASRDNLLANAMYGTNRQSRQINPGRSRSFPLTFSVTPDEYSMLVYAGNSYEGFSPVCEFSLNPPMAERDR